jgi:hypothetical protein
LHSLVFRSLTLGSFFLSFEFILVFIYFPAISLKLKLFVPTDDVQVPHLTLALHTDQALDLDLVGSGKVPAASISSMLCSGLFPL